MSTLYTPNQLARTVQNLNQAVRGSLAAVDPALRPGASVSNGRENEKARHDRLMATSPQYRAAYDGALLKIQAAKAKPTGQAAPYSVAMRGV